MKKLAYALIAVIAQLAFVPMVFAQEGASSTGGGALLGIGAAIAIGLAAFGGALAQGKATASALEGIARNPGSSSKVQTPMIIGLALIESLVIYAFVIAILLQGKI